MNEFHEDGLYFVYPENWKLEFEPGDEGWTAAVQSPGAAFMVVLET